jgi:hypothetical protein
MVLSSWGGLRGSAHRSRLRQATAQQCPPVACPLIRKKKPTLMGSEGDTPGIGGQSGGYPPVSAEEGVLQLSSAGAARAPVRGAFGRRTSCRPRSAQSSPARRRLERRRPLYDQRAAGGDPELSEKCDRSHDHPRGRAQREEFDRRDDASPGSRLHRSPHTNSLPAPAAATASGPRACCLRHTPQALGSGSRLNPRRRPCS